MVKAMVKCNNVPTEVITHGRWIEEGLADNGNKHVVLIFPGNPGVPLFYEEFAKVIKKKLPPETPVWIVGHAGHVQPPKNLSFTMPELADNTQLYDMKGQLEHKAEFIKKYIPKDSHVHLIAHSIGSWFALNLLRDDEIAERVVKCYLLFPTVEHMSESPNGKFLTKFVLPIAWLLVFLAWIFSFFPTMLQFFLVQLFGIFYGIPKNCVKPVLQLLHPDSLRSVFFLAKQEMLNVVEADHELISKHEKKLYFYYSKIDGWTPRSYYSDMKSKHPDSEIEVCKNNFQHSFVLKHAKEMGNNLGDMIVKQMK